MNILSIEKFLKTFEQKNKTPELVHVQGAPSFLRWFLPLFLCAKEKNKKIIVCLNDSKSMESYFKILLSFNDTGGQKKIPLGFFPFIDLWGEEKHANYQEKIHQRLHALSLLIADQSSVVVTSLLALSQKTLSRKTMTESRFLLSVGSTMNMSVLSQKLKSLGYKESYTLDEKGFYSQRGGIFDIWSVHESFPIRIEFFGDLIDSIRKINPENQRSEELLSETFLYRSEEQVFLEDKNFAIQNVYTHFLNQNTDQSILNSLIKDLQKDCYFPEYYLLSPLFCEEKNSFSLEFDDLLYVFPDSLDVSRHLWKEKRDDLSRVFFNEREKTALTLDPNWHFSNFEEIESSLKSSSLIDFGFSEFSKTTHSFNLKEQVDVQVRPLPEKPKEILSFLRQTILSKEGSVFIFVRNFETVNKIKELFEENLKHSAIVIDPQEIKNIFSLALKQKSALFFVQGALGDFFYDPFLEVVFIDEDFLFQKRKTLDSRKALSRSVLSLKDLNDGDLVVHRDYGIGQYRGIKTIEVMGLKSEFLVVQYKDKDLIYIPIDRLKLLQRYSVESQPGDVDKVLDKLGGKGWEIRKKKVEDASKKLAADLIITQAKRELSRGLKYFSLHKDYQSFVDDFPYNETEDQARSIREVEDDLLSLKVMDRLVVGDVGFGKTEVALRAAMMTVLEGYQVLVLVPTTVLCYQMYQTFIQRFDKYAIRIGHLSRLVSNAEKVKTIEQFERGSLDVIIGTHSLLYLKGSEKLGLLVIDEEHRFGVKQKEQVKLLSSKVNVLSMTATPIPRSLHMSLLGLRDISLIQTPPYERKPIKTKVVNYDVDLIKHSLQRELDRHGQIFYLHNHIEELDHVIQFIGQLVPDAKVRKVHGKMKESEIEETLFDFMNQKFSILVCTTIIESGIDLPNANTLIVHASENFGLSQLHQIRGRVGRSHVQAYALFMIQNPSLMMEKAQKRMEALLVNQELGSGYRIATHDLEIRGAGNLLGKEQAGHISSIGFGMFTEMLKDEVDKLKGNASDQRLDPEIKIRVSALIPKEYIKDDRERLLYYQKIFYSDSFEELEQSRFDLIDIFGTLPIEVESLLKIAHMKIILKSLQVKMLVLRDSTVEMQFVSKPKELFRINTSQNVLDEIIKTLIERIA